MPLLNSAHPMDEDFHPEQPSVAQNQAVDDQTSEESFWQWLRRKLGTGNRNRPDRLAALDDAIVMHPESPSNYVLRGELYLKVRDYLQAAHDFEKARHLIERHLVEDNWGIVAQSLQDRALRGLEQARQHLPDDVEATDFETGV